MIPDSAPHIPVMLPQVLAALRPRAGEVYIDGTFGAGGYTRAFLDAASCTVIAIDRDESAVARAAELGKKYNERLIFRSGVFSEAQQIAAHAGHDRVDGFVLDLGVSSMQFDEADRGFSFRFDGPLDMRMAGPGSADVTAAHIVNTYREEDLANLIYQYGEERLSRRVAKAILRARGEAPITRTLQLADIVRSAVPRSGKDGIDPATRTFQALRIAVNRELDELQDALVAAEKILRPGGRLVVVSFHSLEDGIVKHFLQERAGRKSGFSRHLPDAGLKQAAPSFELPSSKPIAAPDEESRANPRARSAKLRLAIRTDAPAWEDWRAA